MRDKYRGLFDYRKHESDEILFQGNFCVKLVFNDMDQAEVVGMFTLKIVKMDGAKHRGWGKRGRDDVMGE